MWGVSKKMLCVLNSFIIPSLSLALASLFFFYSRRIPKYLSLLVCRCRRFPARHFYSSRDIVKSFSPLERE